MRQIALIAFIATTLASPALAQQAPQNPLIDYAGYLRIAAQTQPIRAQRLLSLAAFKANAAKTGAIILDARSAQARLFIGAIARSMTRSAK